MSGTGNGFAPFLPVSDFFLCQKDHTPNRHEQEVKDTDAPMPDRPIASPQISVVQDKERRVAKDTAPLIRVWQM